MIICENATNWRDLSEAKEMIRVAHECGAGLSKFQLFDAEDDKGKPHYAWVKAHALTFDQAQELFDYGASIGQEVFFSVFGVKYVEWCERIGVKQYKVACGYRNKKTLEAIYLTGKHMIVSGRATYESTPEDTHLYCPGEYPQGHMKLRDVFTAQFDGWDGFSDHTIGLDAARIALARGAKIVEKHLCLEHNPDFPDDAWSMDVTDLKELVRWEKVVQECL